MIGTYSENNKYFVFAGNITYCVPETIAGKVVEATPETAVDTIADAIIELQAEIKNHPEDKLCTQVYPEIRRGEHCTFESAREEFEVYREFKVIRNRTYKVID